MNDDGKRGGRVLCFGAGRSAPGLLDCLQGSGYEVTVADVNGEQAAALASRFGLPAERSFQASATDPELVRRVGRFDVVASLLPYDLHGALAEACVEAGVPLVTPSYPDDRIRELGPRVAEKGIPLLVEMGLDPGIDHAKTVQLLDDVRQRGGRVRALRSFCGALPDPEAARTSALRFKLGWSTHSIVSVASKPAAWREGGKDVEIGADAIFTEPWSVPIHGFDEPFEAFPNRDSVPYVEIYGLPQDLPELVRGTLRYRGWSDFWRALRHLGWPHRGLPGERGEIEAALADLEVDRTAVVEVLTSRSGEPGAGEGTDPVRQLERRMDATPSLHYAEGQRDMSIMVIECDYELPSGEERRARSSLTLYGDPVGNDGGGIRAISRATGTALGIGARLVLDGLLDGSLRSHGLTLPVEPAFATRFCELLAEEGIAFTDTDEALGSP